MKNIKYLSLFILMLFTLTACGAKGDAFGKDDDGREINLSVGAKFLIILESNPTTGYRWEVAEMDESVLELLSTEYDADSKSPLVVGSGGAETFSFKAIGSGETTLKLVYHRTWEDAEPAEIFSVKVVVSE